MIQNPPDIEAVLESLQKDYRLATDDQRARFRKLGALVHEALPDWSEKDLRSAIWQLIDRRSDPLRLDLRLLEDVRRNNLSVPGIVRWSDDGWDIGHIRSSPVCSRRYLPMHVRNRWESLDNLTAQQNVYRQTEPPFRTLSIHCMFDFLGSAVAVTKIWQRLESPHWSVKIHDGLTADNVFYNDLYWLVDLGWPDQARPPIIQTLRKLVQDVSAPVKLGKSTQQTGTIEHAGRVAKVHVSFEKSFWTEPPTYNISAHLSHGDSDAPQL